MRSRLGVVAAAVTTISVVRLVSPALTCFQVQVDQATGRVEEQGSFGPSLKQTANDTVDKCR